MNVLIVGLGSIALKHIKAIKEFDVQAKIFAYRSNTDALPVNGVTNIYNLDDKLVVFDFAIISNPTNLHYEFIEVLTEKGIDLFIEKPPVGTLDNIDNLIEKINRANNITYIACNLRFHPCLQYLKNELTNNQCRINEVNVYCGSYLPDWRPDKDFNKIYSANPEMGGGVHLDLFHELDYTYWLFGKPIYTKSLKRNVSTLNIRAFDYANYVFEYEGFTANIVLNYYRKKPKRIIEILFENKTWEIDLIKNTITDDNGSVIFSVGNFKIEKTYTDQMNFFINSLKFGSLKMNTFIDSIEVLKLCLGDE